MICAMSRVLLVSAVYLPIVMLYLPVVSFLIALYAAIYFYSRWTRTTKLPLPPGPPGLPILGNILDAPSNFQWKTYATWSKQYDSDVIHIRVGGQSIIGLQSLQACYDLLEKRSSDYSSRGDAPMVDLMGWENRSMVLMKYGPYWRAHRRAFHSMFNIDAVRRFLPNQTKATNMFLRRMLTASSGDLANELRYMVASVVMDITYGIEAQPENDPYVELADRVFKETAVAGLPNAYLVNIFPSLKHVPDWMPGAGFKRYANRWKKLTARMFNAPFDETVRRMATDPGLTSFVSLLLENARAKRDDVQEDVIKNTATLIYVGAMDTTVATLLSFTLHMLENPEVQRRAQEELDNVLEPGRLPEFGDEGRLPYVTAVVKEAMRVHPVAPMAIPHLYSGKADDMYRDFTIPKGSIFIPNIWAMAHDETAYPTPCAFKPERFLTTGGKLDAMVQDPNTFIFGFGRRICPGKHLGMASVWLTIASILRVYSIEKAQRPDGGIVEPRREYKSSLLQSPEFFECRYVPRNAEAVAIVRATNRVG